MAAFSTTDQAVLTAPLQLDPLAQSATASSSGRSIYHVYDILSTAHKIFSGRFRRVALQFPDEALVDSVPVYWALRKQVRDLYAAGDSSSDPAIASSSLSKSTSILPEFYILADTSYGGCCVDQVAAKHVDADLVVHYGHACLSATAMLPVIYVFTKQPLGHVNAAAHGFVEKAKQILRDANDVTALVLTHDVSWDHVVEEVFQATKDALKQHGVDLPLVRTYVDFSRNYDDKLVNGKSAAAYEESPSQPREDGCCGNSNGVCGGQVRESFSTCCGGVAGSRSSSNHSWSCSNGTTKSTSLSSAVPLSPSGDVSDIAVSRKAQPLGPARTVTLPPNTTFSQCLYLYLGPESLSLTNLLLTLGSNTPLISYSPLTSTSRIETGSTNRLLMKRYASVLKARDASVVGLLVGTLGVHSYLPLLQYLRALLTGKKSGRKVYTISVGKLNPAKLANFQEIDVFVLVACPENTLVDSKEFFKPIVTPFEMELAVKAAERMEKGEEGVEWSGKYVLDLEKLVPDEFKNGSLSDDLLNKVDGMQVGGDGRESGNVEDTERQQQTKEEEEREEEKESDDDDRPHFSLVSGTYVHRRKFNNNKNINDTSNASSHQICTDITSKQALQLSDAQKGSNNHDQVVVRNPTTGQLTTVLETASIAHLNQRGWKGLEERIGLDEPSLLEEGREGIAKGYKDAGGQGHIM
ncbi:related to DPH2 - diphtheria toxin resistance protein [Melanopsichium pennsylvanicum]|uniref:Related to DPH2 - diphtheria toxin resistance protein n=2 Tax=Melanopsichium pennsylvanicum TaxID=63383 RepID=A0AAJ5C5J5_9BASI|nr:related to DPH2-diphtheria toxin resistance protein [Melanopsichium pennsylvanicum 4]SNX84599.1 related to DPH2 - diphtheria toxin resistance protein [Melanopsichium pennsylvanicum]